MQNLPYGDTHTHTGIPVRIQEEASKNCEKFLYGDPHMHTVVVTMWTPTKKNEFGHTLFWVILLVPPLPLCRQPKTHKLFKFLIVMSPLFFVVVSPLLPRGSTSIPSRYQDSLWQHSLWNLCPHCPCPLCNPTDRCMFFVLGGYWGYLSSSSASSCPPSFLLVPIMLWRWEADAVDRAALVDSNGKRWWGESMGIIVLFA